MSTLLVGATAGAVAHGLIIPKRGGLVVWAGELSIELARRPSGEAHVFVDDHGLPVSVDGATGSLDIARPGKDVRTHALVAAPANALSAGRAEWLAGDELQVIVNLADGQVLVAKLTAT
jgi:hypothetical protein